MLESLNRWIQHVSKKRIAWISRVTPVVFAVMAFALIVRSANASITVHDLTESTASGIFTYQIQLDNSADVQDGDGFVIEDFPGLTGFTITGGLTTTQFSESSSLLSNSINQSTSVDAAANLARTVNSLGPDDPTIPNLSFAYVGTPSPFLGDATAVLTLVSSVTNGVTGESVVATLDHSGPGQNFPYALTENAVLVPQPIPEPSPMSITLLSLTGLLVFQGRRISRNLATR
ncbi:MAG TPA: hypothetical protein VGG44_10695 [Tepidisphaeraceae bacterium]|jgi:hypothetical protein